MGHLEPVAGCLAPAIPEAMKAAGVGTDSAAPEKLAVVDKGAFVVTALQCISFAVSNARAPSAKGPFGGLCKPNC